MLHFHKFTKWSDPFVIQRRNFGPSSLTGLLTGDMIDITVQKRSCLGCGRVDVRDVTVGVIPSPGILSVSGNISKEAWEELLTKIRTGEWNEVEHPQ